MPARIVVPLDGSKFAEDALGKALSMVDDGGTLDLVTAVEGAPPFSVPEYDVMAREWAARYLDDVMEKLPPSVTAQPHVLIGVPGREIRGFLEESEADLLVMATHGRGPVSRAWLGSMADLLIRTSRVPLLLVHPEKDEDPAYQADVPIKKVLVPLDGSDLAEAAAEGTRTVLGEGLDMTLFRVVQYPYHFASPYLPDTIQGNQDIFRQATAQAKDYLTEAAWRIAKDDGGVDTEVTVSEYPARAITDYAESNGYDLIAIATHGRGGLKRLALGSVADKVIRTSKVPVLTFRPEEQSETGTAESLARATTAISL